jgi:hypothetical protein
MRVNEFPRDCGHILEEARREKQPLNCENVHNLTERRGMNALCEMFTNCKDFWRSA